MSIELTIPLIFDVVNRMISASDRSREDIITDPLEGTLAISQAGMDQWGNPFGTMNLDVMGTGFGARSDRDGIDVGGIMFSPKGPLPNVENNEQDYPMLYLYRREATDSGGAGEYRGGAGMEACWVPHKTEQIESVILATGGVVPHTRGIGAYPGATVRSLSVRESDVHEQFAEAQLPEDIGDVNGEEVRHPPKSTFTQQGDEVVENRQPGTSGYGDPLRRDPQSVLQDVRRGVVSAEAARRLYGVILELEEGDWVLRSERTRHQRENLLQERLNDSVIPAQSKS